MPAQSGRSVSLIYVCFFCEIENGVKLGIANRMADRAYHLNLDWGLINTKDTFYFQFINYKHSDEIRKIEKDIKDLLKRMQLIIKPRYHNGELANGTGVSEFFSYQGINLVKNFFKVLEKKGQGKIVEGFEPSTNLPPLRPLRNS